MFLLQKYTYFISPPNRTFDVHQFLEKEFLPFVTKNSESLTTEYREMSRRLFGVVIDNKMKAQNVNAN